MALNWPWKKDETAPDYKIFTTAFDVEMTAAELTATLTPTEREQWEQQIALYSTATELAKTQTGVESLKHVDTVKNSAFDPSETVVTILVDHSGSLRGQKAILSCLVVEMMADFLTRLEVRFEILGFTTNEWRGGQSRQQWLHCLCPKNPGRLNDILHIVYRDAAETRPGAPYEVQHMLRSDLLKENIDGEALFWASERLKNLSAQNNLLLVVSDGAPVDDSTLAANAPDILWQHLKDVIDDITKTQGFRLAGVGIDYDPTDLYPDGIRIDGLDQTAADLPRFLASLF